ncbi:MAG: hypothetical protein AAGK00_00385 [Pseudomonadota bacterium]
MRVSALIVMAGFFVVSAVLRAGDVIAQLPAAGQDGYGNPVAVQTQPPPEVEEVRVEVGPEELLEEIRRQRATLEERESRLIEREQTLQALDDKLRERLVEMREARDRLASTASLVNDAATRDVQHLAQMYQQMKPKQAGQIFNQMAPSFAAGFLAEMRPDAAALILASMDAEKAYAVSLLLAGRNVRPIDAQPQAPSN